jgi:hypothetical protein
LIYGGDFDRMGIRGVLILDSRFYGNDKRKKIVKKYYG